MGVGDFVDSGLGKLEDGIDAGKRLVGEGIDEGANAVSDRLDDLGAHGWADTVDSMGDSIASDLGATPDEQQLGQTDQPRRLVHGDAADIRKTAGHLKDFHTAFDTVGGGMRKLDSSSWRGEAAETFREKFAMHPVKWLHAADACETAATALTVYADTVEWAQVQAGEAVALYRAGREADDKAAVERAHEILDEARRQRDAAAGTAATSVRAALAHAPAEPPPLKRLKSDWDDGLGAVNTELTHFVGGVAKGTAGLVSFSRGVSPVDPYNLAHPAEALQNVSMTLSGLVSSAAHPERAAKAAWEGFKKDPSEFGGRLVPELFGTKGTGLGRTGLKTAVKEGMEEAAGSGAQRAARQGATETPESTSRRPQERVYKEDPVDVATGSMVLPQTDLSLPGSLPLAFKRSFESSYRAGRWFGPTWSSTVDQRLEIDSEGVLFVAEGGLLLAYPHPAPGLPVLPAYGPRWYLDREDDGYTITDPESHQVRHFTDQSGVLSVLEQIDDRNGNWITFEYDTNGAPTGISHSSGRRVKLTTANDRITGLHLSGAAADGSDQEILRYGYTEGHLTEVTNSSGRPLRLGYDELGRITSWTDTNGSRFEYVYDEQDRCTYQSGVVGHQRSTFTYDTTDPETGERVTTITDSHGHSARYLFNDRMQVTAEIDETGAVTRFQRDRRNRILSRTDPLGHTTSFRYDETGNLLALTRPDGREARAEYNELGLPVKVVNLDRTVVRQTYDRRGNRTSVTDSAGQCTRFAYNEAGHLTAVTDPLGHMTTIRCDRAGLPTETMDPLGGVTTYERDTFGRTVTITDPTGAVTRAEWTVEGHLSRWTAPDGTTESWAYDGEGNCIGHTDPMGDVSRFEYTHFDLLIARTGPDGARYEFDHDMELRLTKVTNPQGLTWMYDYDESGRLVTETDFDDRALMYEYDEAGRLTSRTNALGRRL